MRKLSELWHLIHWMPVLQQNNVNSISARFKRIHNASEYETDPNHITRIIHPKMKIMSAFNHPNVEHKYITFFNISLVFYWRKKSWVWVNFDRIMIFRWSIPLRSSLIAKSIWRMSIWFSQHLSWKIKPNYNNVIILECIIWRMRKKEERIRNISFLMT